MDSTADVNKKVNFEDLPKEDLVKKCYHLLALAQKAKQSKNVLLEENSKLKEHLSSKNVETAAATQELIDNLTQQKLSVYTSLEKSKSDNEFLTNKLQRYENELNVCRKNLDTCDNEKKSYQKQINRLNEDNEVLLNNLDSLEKQIDQLNKIGIQQREQLLELEKQKTSNQLISTEGNTTVELQNMLSVSLKEVKRLQEENTSHVNMIEHLQITLSEKDKNILIINEELLSCKEQVNILSSELNELKVNRIRECDKSQTKDEDLLLLQEGNNKLKEKLKLYHSKIIKFAGIAKNLREDKNKILHLSKSYMDQVKEWKNQLHLIEDQLINFFYNLKTENNILKTKLSEIKSNTNLELDKIRTVHSVLEEEYKDKLKSYEDEVNRVKLENVSCNNKINEERKISSNLTSQLNKCQGLIDKYKCEIETLTGDDKEFAKQINELKTKLNSTETDKDCITKEFNDLKNISKQFEDELNQLKQENNMLLNSKEDLLKQIDLLNDENRDFNNRINNNNKLLEEHENNVCNYEKVISGLKNEIKFYEELGNRSSEEIKKLAEEMKVLVITNESLEDKLRQLQLQSATIDASCQTDEFSTMKDQEQLILELKRENFELLSEMNEMNQAIKERGEIISKLEVHVEEIVKKLQIYETQANKNIDNISEKEKVIENLTKEIEVLKSKGEMEKDKFNANLETSYAESENMSTSTISRTEEMNRLKDLEGSWEERYGKLRNLAVKLKSKVKELTNSLTQQQNENEELQTKFATNIKMIQNLQNKSDQLEDELEKSKQECKEYLNRLNSMASDTVKFKEELVMKDDVINQLKQEQESLKSDKQTMENWKKQISVKVQILRKEVEANNVLKKDFELRISKLNSDLETKDQALKTEIENHKQTKNLLDQSNNECKKNSVLNLEMQDYERSVKETSKKLEQQLEQITKLSSQLESQKTTNGFLREQNKLLEEQINDKEQTFMSLTSEIDNNKSKIAKLEEELQQKDSKIQNLTLLLESSRSETEELSVELSKIISEHQKTNTNLKIERDNLRGQNLGLQQSLGEVQDSLKLKSEELNVLKKEFEEYKIRAQSVLRQNQNRDVGLEEKLSEEITLLRANNLELSTQLKSNEEKIKSLEVSLEEVTSENFRSKKQIVDLDEEINDLKIQYTQLSSNHEKTVSENAETIRSLKIHADTLLQCYRQQLAEQESRHNTKITELKSRLSKVPTPTETIPIPLTMPREEGEGSESVESSYPMSNHPVPLERLLGSDFEQNLEKLQKQLSDQESKVAHLTALLSDTEKDLVKHIQMNNLLKEEIRRQQRSEEREKHAENLEYLKNVVFKFVTLGSGDERSRLVPVLNTILKLSPDETKQLSIVAKGEGALKGWSNYLPSWSSPNRPQ